ncbi:MAG: SBBP repeat-containing protein, partial [Candidatus Thorarchaeota archaeon]
MPRRLLLFLTLFVMVSTMIVAIPAAYSSTATDANMAAPSESQTLVEPPTGNERGAVNRATMPFGGFIKNIGQVHDTDVVFYVQTSRTKVAFRPSCVTVVSDDGMGHPVRTTVWFSGSNLVSPEGMHKKTHVVNYFIASEQYTGIPTYDEVIYRNLYDGIDLRYYMTEQGLKSEFVVHPGADPHLISVQVEGGSLSVSPDHVTVKVGEKTAYGETNLLVLQGNHRVDAGFVQTGTDSYGFRIGDYDVHRTLIIDPIVITMSGFIGGSLQETAGDVCVSGSYIYVLGHTYSSDVPLKNAVDSDPGSTDYADLVIVKMTQTGELVFSTYLGGTYNEYAGGIAVDSSGNIYVSGTASGSDYPVVNAYQSTRQGYHEVVVTKLSSDGSTLLYSTYLGGTGEDYTGEIAVDSSGRLYVTGYTESSDFDLANALDSTHNGTRDAFVTVFNSTGNGLVFSTYLGGAGDEYGRDIALDGSNNIYVVGRTTSNDFPLVNAFDSTRTYDEAFITKILSDFSGYSYSSFYGGGSTDDCRGVIVDSSGAAYLAGYTKSNDIPLVNALDSTLSGDEDGFVAKVSATGTLLYSTYIGGSSNDQLSDIGIDSDANMYVVGYSASSDYPLKDSIRHDMDLAEIIVTKLASDGQSIAFSTFLGGGSIDYGYDIYVTPEGNMTVLGLSESSDFPTRNAFDMTHAGGRDITITRLYNDTQAPTITLNSPANGSVLTSGSLINFSVSDNVEVETVLYDWDGGSTKALNPPYDIPMTSGDGTHTLHITAYDTGHNQASATYTFVCDDTPPIVTLTTPVNGTNQYSGTIVEVNVTEPHFNYVFYRWSTESSETVWWSTPYQTQVPITEGWAVLYVYATDTVGHATNASFWFTVKADYGLMFSTYLGGDSADAGYDIEVDSHGDVYVVGSTAGSGFPADSYDTTHNGGHDVFVTKMDTRTGTLLWSTYIGGSSNDIAYGVAVDPDLNVYVTGVTYSSDFPTVNAYDSTFSGGNDAFVVKLNPGGSALIFSTYFGIDDTKGNSIDVTSAGEAVICGVTQGIPTANAYQSSIGEHSDAFVTKFNSTGTGLVFSTYLGGNGNQYVDGEYRSDEANDVELGPSDTVNVVGTTCSSDFPVANANDTTLGGESDAFVASFTSSGAIRFCTYLGGSDKEFGTGVAVNPVGSVVATGTTWSSDFPVQ